MLEVVRVDRLREGLQPVLGPGRVGHRLSLRVDKVQQLFSGGIVAVVDVRLAEISAPASLPRPVAGDRHGVLGRDAVDELDIVLGIVHLRQREQRCVEVGKPLHHVVRHHRIMRRVRLASSREDPDPRALQSGERIDRAEPGLLLGGRGGPAQVGRPQIKADIELRGGSRAVVHGLTGVVLKQRIDQRSVGTGKAIRAGAVIGAARDDPDPHDLAGVRYMILHCEPSAGGYAGYRDLVWRDMDPVALFDRTQAVRRRSSTSRCEYAE